jgi:hypothetical protein
MTTTVAVLDKVIVGYAVQASDVLRLAEHPAVPMAARLVEHEGSPAQVVQRLQGEGFRLSPVHVHPTCAGWRARS